MNHNGGQFCCFVLQIARIHLYNKIAPTITRVVIFLNVGIPLEPLTYCTGWSLRIVYLVKMAPHRYSPSLKKSTRRA